MPTHLTLESYQPRDGLRAQTSMVTRPFVYALTAPRTEQLPQVLTLSDGHDIAITLQGKVASMHGRSRDETVIDITWHVHLHGEERIWATAGADPSQSVQEQLRKQVLAVLYRHSRLPANFEFCATIYCTADHRPQYLMTATEVTSSWTTISAPGGVLRQWLRQCMAIWRRYNPNVARLTSHVHMPAPKSKATTLAGKTIAPEAVALAPVTKPSGNRNRARALVQAPETVDWDGDIPEDDIVEFTRKD